MWLFISGCAGFDEPASLREAGPGPWKVIAKNSVPYGHKFRFGPFQTSAIGPFHGNDLRRQPRPEGETVRFIKDRVSYAFDVEHASGAVAEVRAGIEDNDRFDQVGFLTFHKKDVVVGSVQMSDQLVGQFSIHQRVKQEEIEAGWITTSKGTIRVMRRLVPLRQSPSAVAAFFQPDNELVDEYSLGDQLVASRHYGQQTLWIDDSLPVEAQCSIAAALTMPLLQEVLDAEASQAAMLNQSAYRVPGPL